MIMTSAFCPMKCLGRFLFYALRAYTARDTGSINTNIGKIQPIYFKWFVAGVSRYIAEEPKF